MGEPMTEQRLKEIEAKIAKIETSRTLAGIQIMTGDPAAVVREDVPDLVAEVRRLRGVAVQIRKHINDQCRCASSVVCLDEIDTLAMLCEAPPKPEGT